MWYVEKRFAKFARSAAEKRTGLSTLSGSEGQMDSFTARNALILAVPETTQAVAAVKANDETDILAQNFN